MSNKVDHLDLSLRIPNHLLEKVELWLEHFSEDAEEVIAAPKIKKSKSVLRINSQDFIQFLGFVNPEDLSSLDLQRLKSDAKDQLTGLQNKALRPEYRYHYQWCLAALENFELGRFLPEEIRPSGSESN